MILINGDHMTNKELDLIFEFSNLSKKYNIDIYRLLLLVNEFQEILLSLDDVSSRVILEYRYMNGYSFKEIGQKLGFSQTKARKLHKYSIENILQNYE